MLPYFHPPAQLVSPGTANLLLDTWDGGRDVSGATLHMAVCREICLAGVESLLLPTPHPQKWYIGLPIYVCVVCACLRPLKAYDNPSACWKVSIAVACFFKWISVTAFLLWTCWLIYMKQLKWTFKIKSKPIYVQTLLLQGLCN